MNRIITRRLARFKSHCDSHNPRNVNGLFCWMRADLLTTLVGSGVSAINDISGNGIVAAQGAPTTRPTLSSVGTNIKHIVSGPNSTWFQFQNNVWSSLTAAEVFIVSRIDATSTFGTIYGIGGTADGCFFTGGGIYDSFGSTVRYNAGSFGVEVQSPFIYNVSAGTNTWTNRLNGVIKYSNTSNVVAWNPISHLLTLVNTDPSTFYLIGDFYELIVYNHVLSANERLIIMSYLSSRYNIKI